MKRKGTGKKKAASVIISKLLYSIPFQHRVKKPCVGTVLSKWVSPLRETTRGKKKSFCLVRKKDSLNCTRS